MFFSTKNQAKEKSSRLNQLLFQKEIYPRTFFANSIILAGFLVKVLIALAETRALKRNPVRGSTKVLTNKLGKNRRLVFRLEWLTLLPTEGFLPVKAHTLAITFIYKIAEKLGNYI